MRNKNIISLINLIVIFVGLSVLIGWILNIPILKSIHPNWVTMKFMSALCFVVSGMILVCLSNLKGTFLDLSMVCLPILSLVLSLLMVPVLVTSFTGIQTGIEVLFVAEAKGAVMSVAPGRPSVGTMIAFLLIITAALGASFKGSSLGKVTCLIGAGLVGIAVIAIFGYAFSLPFLYYSIASLSTAMAMHAAILFLLMGINLILIGRTYED